MPTTKFGFFPRNDKPIDADEMGEGLTMHSPNLYEERRGSTRRHVFHTVKMLIGADTAPRDCLILGISDGGVRLYVVGFNVPDEFVLLLSGNDGIEEQNKFKVVWRQDNEVGAELVRIVQRPGITEPEKHLASA